MRTTIRGLFKEAKAMRIELLRTKWAIREKIAGKWRSFKEAVKPIREEAKTIVDEMKVQHKSMKDLRSQLKEAVKARDREQAAAILEQMIDVKTDKNSNLSRLVELRKEIMDIVD